MPLWIKLLKIEGIGQQVRADGPKRHLVKQGTPTMGGVVILLGIVVSCLLLAQPVPSIMLAAGAALATGALGLLDDVTSVAQGRSLGLTPRAKMVGLTLIVVAFFLAAVNLCGVEPVIRFPGGFAIDLGVLTTTFSVAGTTISVPWLYLVFVFLLLAGMSNAVNLTDGLDGLAGGTVMIAMLVMAAICFLRGDANLGHLLRRMRGRLPWLSVVQRLSGKHLHGRYRFACAGRGLCRRRRAHQPGGHLLGSGRLVHRRGAFRHHPGRQL